MQIGFIPVEIEKYQALVMNIVHNTKVSFTNNV